MKTLLFFRYHPNVQAIACLLRCLQVKVHIQSIEQQLEHHPDWPSLLCISDALHQWKVPHLAAKAADKQLPGTHYPFVAVTNHPERPLAIVTRVDGGRVQFYQYSYNTLSEEDLASFVQRWTGVYLLAEANAQSGEPDYAAVRRKWWLRQALPAAAVLLLLVLLTGGIWPRLMLAGSGAAMLGTATLALLYVAGLIVSGLLLWYEIDQSNPLLKKVCTGLAKTDCHAILSSNASKLFGCLSWSEVGAAYFAGGLLLLAMPARAPWALQWLGLLGMAALLYPVFSIYYQWRVARQWCVLCLAVQAILLLQGLALWAGHFLPQVPATTFAQFLIPNSPFLLTTAYLLPLLAWLSLKPLLLRWQTARQQLRAYRRLKFNPQVFTGLLQQQKAITTAPEGLGITLGPANAPHKLVKVCNPYCGPCSKAHPKMEKLLHQHSNLQLQILFMVPDTPGQRLHTTASHLMAIAQTATTQVQVQQALDHWYLAENKDYEAFAAKYPLNGQVAEQAPAITAMEKWSQANDIRYTPTIFFNGYELPPEYDPEDLTYFLQE
jgi:uncharacterized membrane protein